MPKRERQSSASSVIPPPGLAPWPRVTSMAATSLGSPQATFSNSHSLVQRTFKPNPFTLPLQSTYSVPLAARVVSALKPFKPNRKMRVLPKSPSLPVFCSLSCFALRIVLITPMHVKALSSLNSVSLFFPVMMRSWLKHSLFLPWIWSTPSICLSLHSLVSFPVLSKSLSIDNLTLWGELA